MSSSPAPEMRLILELGLLLEAAAAQAGIKRGDLECMLAIAFDGSVAAGDLAAKLNLSSGGMTGTLDRLERQDLVARTTDPDDRRRTVIVLTPAGATLLDTAIAPIQALLQAPRSRVLAAGLASGELLAAVETARRSLRPASTAVHSQEVTGLFELPLGNLQRAAIEFNARFEEINLIALDEPGLLMRARLGSGARVRTDGVTVTVAGHRTPFGAAPGGEVLLQPLLPWAIRIRGGAMKLRGTLQGVPLAALEISGGKVEGALYINPLRSPIVLQVRGGDARLALRMPSEASVRVRHRGGLLALTVNGARVAVPRDTGWRRAGSPASAPALDVEVRGGMLDLALTFDASRS